jgi:sec-independent protein translocase protein TatA
MEGLFSPWHLLLLMIIGVLLFGKRLPEIGRQLGRGLVEFKKGLKGLEDEINVQIERSSTSRPAAPAASLEPPRPPQRVPTAAPKFTEAANGSPTPPQV